MTTDGGSKTPALDRLEGWKECVRDVVTIALESTLRRSWAARDAVVFNAACEALEKVDSSPCSK